MTQTVISTTLKNKLLDFLKTNHKADLVAFYLYFLENKNDLKPVLFPKEKKIYQSLDQLIQKLEEERKLWRETEIKIQFGEHCVDEQTKKIYICPHSGKVFGDNTHPNPQDAIYEWVSTCPENKEIVGGLKAKRFLVSEDPEVIKNYITKRKEPITKIVFSSAISGKLFNSREAVVEDFKKNHVKKLSLLEVQNQNRFEIEEHFLKFLQEELKEEKISAFVNALAKLKEFELYVQKWLES
ncbi:MAG: DUF2709 domain-containing protein [Parachlamydiales bacterium]|jgi:hypothetical protein